LRACVLACLRACVLVLCLLACSEGGGRDVAPAGESLSLLRRKKGTKERATLLAVTPPLRAGATCDARSRGALRNSLRADALRSDSRSESVNEGVCPSAHARPAPCASRHGQKGTQEHGPSLRSAPDARRAVPAPVLGRAQRWPVWMWLLGCPTPSGCAWGGALAGWHARWCAHASLTDSPWLFERSAAGAQRVPRRTPQVLRRRLPPRSARGSQPAGSPSLW
jgi:hypothetical protein